jgi:nucleoside-diphosphate-sugar epimerase
MRVLITGGTGFVGAHTVEALVAAGHEPRLLVRDPRRLPRQDLDHVVGDATDRDGVARALDGMDAVVHGASVVSLNIRDAARVLDVNRKAAEVVLRQAVDRGLDPVIHVSSLSALMPTEPGGVIDRDAPVSTAPGTYARSKAAAEQIARDLQDGGAPVVTTYPSMVMGPRDPNMGEGMSAYRNLLRGRTPAMPPGGLHIIDVRDVAAAHRAALEPGRGPRRFLVTGHHMTAAEALDHLRALTGRPVRVAWLPTGLVHAGGRVADAVQRVVPVRIPVSYEMVTSLTADPRCDDGATRNELGLEYRPLDETVTDAVRWMVAEGLVSRAQAGRLA